MYLLSYIIMYNLSFKSKNACNLNYTHTTHTHTHARTHTHTHIHTHTGIIRNELCLIFMKIISQVKKVVMVLKIGFIHYMKHYLLFIYLVVKMTIGQILDRRCVILPICTQAFKKHIVLWKYYFHGNDPPDIHTMILPDFQPSAVRFHRNMWQGLPDERDFNLMVSWRQATWGTKEQIAVIFSNACVQR